MFGVVPAGRAEVSVRPKPRISRAAIVVGGELRSDQDAFFFLGQSRKRDIAVGVLATQAGAEDIFAGQQRIQRKLIALFVCLCEDEWVKTCQAEREVFLWVFFAPILAPAGFAGSPPDGMVGYTVESWIGQLSGDS